MNKKNKSKDLKQLKLKFFEHKMSKKGFSLIETLVAIMIFSMAIAMFMGAFSSFIRVYLGEKKNQKNFENAQYAINLMAKSLRTSDLGVDYSPGVIDEIDAFDYTQNQCIRYKFINNKISIATPGGSDFDNCAFAGIVYPDDYSDLTDDNIEDARIDAEKSDDSGALYKYGKVTISLIVRDDSQGTIKIPIETTVSLRQ